MTNHTCTLDDCDKPSRNTHSAALCKMHYHRQYRHGSVDKVATNTTITASKGRRYRTTYQPGHPVAAPSGNAYVHRVVLYDAIGPGPHPCHWCSTPVDWLPKATPGELQPDHLNGDGADNRLENLVPACRACNSTRGLQARSEALRAAGWWSQNDTVARLSAGGRRAPIEAA